MSDFTSPEFRVSYPAVFKARRNPSNGKDEFSITMLFPKATTDMNALYNAANKVATERWGAKIPHFKNNPFKDGDGPAGINKDGTPKKGYAGHWVVSAKAQGIVGVVDASGKQYITDPAQLYGGCYARAILRAFAYPKAGVVGQSEGVSFAYVAIQKTREGEPFGAAPVDAAQSFDAVGIQPVAGANTFGAQPVAAGTVPAATATQTAAFFGQAS